MSDWRARARAEAVVLPIGGVIGALVAWQAVISLGLVSDLFLPSPMAVLRAWVREWRYFGLSIATTVYDVLVCLTVGATLAVGLGVTVGLSDRLRHVVMAPLLALSPIPIITFIPLFIMWAGLGKPPVILCGILGAFFPALLGTIAGITHINPLFVEVARNFGASNRAILRSVVLPHATPYVVNGLRIATQMTFIITTVAEMVIGDAGLGGLIARSANLFRTDMVVGGQLALGVLGLGIYRLFDVFEAHTTLRWQPPRQLGH